LVIKKTGLNFESKLLKDFVIRDGRTTGILLAIRKTISGLYFLNMERSSSSLLSSRIRGSPPDIISSSIMSFINVVFSSVSDINTVYLLTLKC